MGFIQQFLFRGLDSLRASSPRTAKSYRPSGLHHPRVHRTHLQAPANVTTFKASWPARTPTSSPAFSCTRSPCIPFWSRFGYSMARSGRRPRNARSARHSAGEVGCELVPEPAAAAERPRTAASWRHSPPEAAIATRGRVSSSPSTEGSMAQYSSGNRAEPIASGMPSWRTSPGKLQTGQGPSE
jgi:hypothetical protein